MMWLSRAIKDAGHETKCALPARQGLGSRSSRSTTPDVVCYSVTTGHAPLLPGHQQEGQAGPARTSSTVMGGRAPDLHPRGASRSYDHVDAICRGEGEEAMAELLTRMEAGEDWSTTCSEHVVPPPRDGRDPQERPAAARSPDLDSARLPGSRASIYDAGAIYARLRPQGVRHAARLPDELLLLLPPRVEEEGRRHDQREVRPQALGRPRDRRDQGGPRQVQPEVRPLPRRHLQPLGQVARRVLREVPEGDRPALRRHPDGEHDQ